MTMFFLKDKSPILDKLGYVNSVKKSNKSSRGEQRKYISRLIIIFLVVYSVEWVGNLGLITHQSPTHAPK